MNCCLCKKKSIKDWQVKAKLIPPEHAMCDKCKIKIGSETKDLLIESYARKKFK